jgi:Na+/melibiose symporter-like transporter
VDKDALFAFLQQYGMVITDTSGVWNSLLDKLGLVLNADRSNLSSVGFSLFNISGKIVTVAGVIASVYLSTRYGKRAVAIVGFALATILMSAFILLPSNAIGATFLLEWARSLAYAPTIPLIWAMFADVADYAEWKTGRRITGLVFATILFALKTGLSLGGAIAGWLLSGYGYVANVAQTPNALLGIRMTVSIYPAIFLVIVVICLFAYKITKKLNLQIQDELAERRRVSNATLA